MPTFIGIKAYQLSMNPLQLSTGSCKRDCTLAFDFTPKMPCSYDSISDEYSTKVQISWTAQYTVKGQAVYFPNPDSMFLNIKERDFSNDELQELKENDLREYDRYTKCKEIAADSTAGVIQVCTENEEKTNTTADCIPSALIDSDRLLLDAIETLPTQEKRKWWQNFWQKNWNWEYVVMGSATVCLGYALFRQLDCVGGKSVLIEMLENMPLELDIEQSANQELIVSQT